MQRCVLLLSLLVILAACGPVALPTPGPMVAQSFMPLMARSYPRVERAVAGFTWNVMDAPYHHWTVTGACNDDFSPTVWCVDDYHLALVDPQIVYSAEHCPGATWIFLNEPDQIGDVALGGQCGAYALTGNPFDPDNPSPKVHDAPEETAMRFSATYDLLKTHDPTARVFVGGMGWIGYPSARDWWARFVAELERRGEMWKIEAVHFHAYPYGSFPAWGMAAFPQNVRDFVEFNASLGLGDRELWITETGGGPCTAWERWDAIAWATIRDAAMEPMERWMDTEALALGITRVFWFVSWDGINAPWWCNYLIDAREAVTATPLGAAWR